jgi:CheY-like chemotaxis protein
LETKITQSKSILLVDDSPVVRVQLRSLFEDAGFHCDEAENGRQAVDIAADLRPDVIVLDFSMPVMNGLQAGRLLKNKLPQTPIVMFSMFADGPMRSIARDVGISAVISKENAASELLPKVSSLLQSLQEDA